jgi:hypothetical protein
VYVPQLDVEDYILLAPHLRWKKRKLDFSYKMTVKVSVWSDQGTFVNRQTELKSPAPNPRPEGSRRDFLANDKKFQAEGEALGVAMQSLNLLPGSAERQKRLLTDAAATGKSYSFRLAAEGKATRTFLMRFNHGAGEAGAIEAQVVDAETKKPLNEPLWKGELAPAANAGYVIRFDSKWVFQIAPDDRPMMVAPAEGGDGKPGQHVALLQIKRD